MVAYFQEPDTLKQILRALKRKVSDAAIDVICEGLMRSSSLRGRRTPFGAEELRLVYQALRSQHLGGTNGHMVAAFESAFAASYGVPYAVSSTSGTAAIHVALGALDLNPGDEIVTAPITDMGTIIPILYQNAIPVFADVDDTYNMDPNDVERKITARTRAIIAVHLFGNPCDMDAMVEIARRHGLVLIEDSSQAHMTSYKDKYVGTIGDIGCFSFQQSKPMTTGEGGMTITWNKAYYDRMKLFVDKGFARKGGGPRAYLFHAPNYRITELVAAVGLAQLRKVQRVVSKRSELGRYMTERLTGLKGVIPAPVTPGAEHTFWQYPIRLTDCDPRDLAAALREAKISSLPGYTGEPIYLCSESLHSKKTYGDSQFPFTSLYSSGTYEYEEGLCPNAERLLDQLLCIPWDESWTRRKIDRVVDIIQRFLSASTPTSISTASPLRPDPRPVATSRADSARERIAIIGCGRIGQWHLRAYRRHPEAAIVAVADVDFERARAMAAEVGANAYRSHSEMLASETLDAASVCSVPSTHHNITIDLLEAGVHVLCEKPLALTVAELREMLDKARTANRLLMPAFKYRFHEEVENARRLLATGSLGRILTFRVMFGGQLDMAGTWYVRPEISGGGVIIDNGPHALDLVRHLMGEIADISADATASQAYGVEDTSKLTVRLEDGTVGTIDLSWALAVPARAYLEIFGEQGTVLADLQGVTYRYKTWSDWKRLPNRTGFEDTFVQQAGHFLDAIRRKHPPVVTAEDALKPQILIEAVYESIRRRSRVAEPIRV
jgi:dTDP-4-amino-4,6-dideoxygalactose transaminase/predicted dehydrogenase